MRREVTRAEIAALLAVAQDHAFGQPPGAQLRGAVLGQQLAEAAGAEHVERAATWWTPTLRFLGCTGHAFESALVYGDEIELRARSLQLDMGNAGDVLKLIAGRAGPGQSGVARLPAVLAALAGGKKEAELNFRTACEVADAFAVRLGLDEVVRSSLAANFERWNGKGLPAGTKGTAIPRPMRIAQLSQELEVLARMDSVEGALAIVEARRDKGYDPELVDVVLADGAGWWAEVEAEDPWDAALDLAPPCAPLDDAEWRGCLLVLADFADLKSPWTSGHSRAVAELAREASGPEAEAAALVLDRGCVAVPNSIWDMAGPLTLVERDRAETHALVTDQRLRRVPSTAALADGAAAAHERLDGAGYHRRLGKAGRGEVQRVVAAADCYQAMVSERPHRHALAAEEAAGELRSMATDGRLDPEAVERVLAAAGPRRAPRAALPAGLTPREAEVLQPLALGLTTKQVAERLVISTKTAGHHVQHIYSKIGVSTRGAATLFAIEHGILATDRL